MILIADIVLFFHFCIVVFITFGFVLIPIGYNFNWIWIKNKKLRLLHFGMMIFVTFETILGLSCPLTVLENNDLLKAKSNTASSLDIVTSFIDSIST